MVLAFRFSRALLVRSEASNLLLTIKEGARGQGKGVLTGVGFILAARVVLFIGMAVRVAVRLI